MRSKKAVVAIGAAVACVVAVALGFVLLNNKPSSGGSEVDGLSTVVDGSHIKVEVGKFGAFNVSGPDAAGFIHYKIGERIANPKLVTTRGEKVHGVCEYRESDGTDTSAGGTSTYVTEEVASNPITCVEVAVTGTLVPGSEVGPRGTSN